MRYLTPPPPSPFPTPPPLNGLYIYRGKQGKGGKRGIKVKSKKKIQFILLLCTHILKKKIEKMTDVLLHAIKAV